MKQNEIVSQVKMPRTLYTHSEIRKYFDNNYSTLSNILNGYRGQATVKNDWGVWYHVTALDATDSMSKRLKLTKAKLTKSGEPVVYL